LNRERVLKAAVALADTGGIEALSMRRLAQDLTVVPMALYKHVANKEELLDGMMDLLISEVDSPAPDTDWKSAVRMRVLASRRVLLRHPWACSVLESRTTPTPAVLEYIDSLIGIFLVGGFSVDLTHHVMHALGSRMWGFTQELFNDSRGQKPAAPVGIQPEERAAMLDRMAVTYANIAAIASSMTHDHGSVVAQGCDDQFEFEFALDLVLDGFDRLRRTGWSSSLAGLPVESAPVM
jgi:AcrR family transcriptional regulator